VSCSKFSGLFFFPFFFPTLFHLGDLPLACFPSFLRDAPPAQRRFFPFWGVGLFFLPPPERFFSHFSILICSSGFFFLRQRCLLHLILRYCSFFFLSSQSGPLPFPSSLQRLFFFFPGSPVGLRAPDFPPPSVVLNKIDVSWAFSPFRWAACFFLQAEIDTFFLDLRIFSSSPRSRHSSCSGNGISLRADPFFSGLRVFFFFFLQGDVLFLSRYPAIARLFPVS